MYSSLLGSTSPPPSQPPRLISTGQNVYTNLSVFVKTSVHSGMIPYLDSVRASLTHPGSDHHDPLIADREHVWI